MPHFDKQGRDTVICQVCASIVTEATWRPDITGNKSAGNVCNKCLREHDEKARDVPPSLVLEMVSAIDECDTALAVLNMTCDLTPQGRKCLRDAWHKVQGVLMQLRPDSAMAQVIRENRAEGVAP